MRHTTRYSSNLSYSGRNKTILVFLDGTWNDENGHAADGLTTSIYHLFTAVAGQLDSTNTPWVKTHAAHTALYFRGIGNDEEHDTLGTFYGAIFGAGEKGIRDHAYCEILRHYNKGDRLVLIGFSRGAACARLLAAKLHRYGIKQTLKVTHTDRENEKFFLQYTNIDETNVAVDVDFLGLFDTVGAFGIPLNLPGLPFQKLNLFKDLTIANNVRRAVHCVAIDESREAFIPTLCNKASHIDEVWFAGVHGDIGGGYQYAELGKIALAYMVDKLHQALAEYSITYDELLLQQLTEYSLEYDEIRMHYHGDGIKRRPREIFVSVNNTRSSHKPKVHHSVAKLQNSSNLFVAENFASFTTMTPILYSPENVKTLTQPLKLVK
jgi:uncharacterized protein (DUF2235 family)